MKEYLLLLFFLYIVVADPYFSSLLYQDVPNDFCSRFYYKNGGIGCHSFVDGVSGVLLPISTTDDLKKLENSKWKEIVVLVNSTQLSRFLIDLQYNYIEEVVEIAIAMDSIVGIAIYGNEKPIYNFSPLSKTPNGKGTPSESIALHPDYEWNPSGFNLFYQDLSKPIVHIQDKQTISVLLEKANRNAEEKVQNEYRMDMQFYMGPEHMNSPTCLAKGACLPLGGQSLWALAGQRDNRPIVVIATALDSLSFLYERGEDELNAGTRLTVSLAILHSLQSIQLENASKQLMFAFFEGESWGRIGSRYFLADLQDFTCPNRVEHDQSPFNDAICTFPLRISLEFTSIQLAAIEKVIILDQLLPMKDSLYFHSEPGFSIEPFSSILSIQPSSVQKIPPGTGESFYQAGITNTVVITGYDDVFETKYFGSIYHESIDNSKLPAISKTLLDFILREIGITESTEIDIDYLTSIYQCFAVNGNCTVIEDLMGYKRDSITSQLKNKPINKFVGTYNAGKYPMLILGSSYAINTTLPIDPQKTGIYFTPSLLESFIHTSLSQTFYQEKSNITCSSWSDCRSMKNGYCIQGKCIASTAYYHNAMDPALSFIVTGINSFTVKSMDTNSPIYTEPFWGGYYGSIPSVSVYQKTSMITEWVTFIIGIIVTVIAWYATQYFFSTYGTQVKINK